MAETRDLRELTGLDLAQNNWARLLVPQAPTLSGQVTLRRFAAGRRANSGNTRCCCQMPSAFAQGAVLRHLLQYPLLNVADGLTDEVKESVMWRCRPTSSRRDSRQRFFSLPGLPASACTPGPTCGGRLPFSPSTKAPRVRAPSSSTAREASSARPGGSSLRSSCGQAWWNLVPPPPLDARCGLVYGVTYRNPI